MQKKLVTTLNVVLVVTLSGCASQTAWTPMIDPYSDPNANRISADQAECKQLASQTSGGTGMETAKGAAVGGLMGAALGAAIGAAVGDAGTGAALGAAAGGIGGGAHQGMGSEDQYKRAYANCLRRRGHTVVN